ncbi:hypothetical protein GJV52_02890 [Neisseria brasiliensis]|nr:hypothetical protein GJV52_02890 [Neisseria brasiliensis]
MIDYQRKDCVTPPAAPPLDAPKKPPVWVWLHPASTKVNTVIIINFFIIICISIKFSNLSPNTTPLKPQQSTKFNIVTELSQNIAKVAAVSNSFHFIIRKNHGHGSF